MDTSAWFALRFQDDHGHAAAQNIHRRLVKDRQPLHTSDWVLSETVALLGRRDSRATAIEVGGTILCNPLIQVHGLSPELLGRVWERYASGATRFSLVDCSSFVTMESLGLTRVFAFDEDFVKAGFRVERAS